MPVIPLSMFECPGRFGAGNSGGIAEPSVLKDWGLFSMRRGGFT
ncbi:hypothetical protein TC41_1928 [Alicyclobacillus acidocaldarius subsp. acidocaldarius Tc-4-1]|uniref:Uncharacterized protein n=1 Tax=Alicyclobacillus acidocaldarius (strain Tc-4-1) TaxID=1048834 RepID=F8IDJ0_ALIAT|nr:hypothetical protein TC41_1928 [Alicyclobacillus acidocaldarius subsp. acidocaldarius Tc-4-1]